MIFYMSKNAFYNYYVSLDLNLLLIKIALINNKYNFENIIVNVEY